MNYLSNVLTLPSWITYNDGFGIGNYTFRLSNIKPNLKNTLYKVQCVAAVAISLVQSVDGSKYTCENTNFLDSYNHSYRLCYSSSDSKAAANDIMSKIVRKCNATLSLSSVPLDCWYKYDSWYREEALIQEKCINVKSHKDDITFDFCVLKLINNDIENFVSLGIGSYAPLAVAGGLVLFCGLATYLSLKKSRNNNQMNVYQPVNANPNAVNAVLNANQVINLLQANNDDVEEPLLNTVDLQPQN